MKVSKLLRYFTILIALLLISCGGGASNGGANQSDKVTISGVAQKGPLQSGSTVTIIDLDSNLGATGKAYPDVSIVDDLGQLDPQVIAFTSKYIRLTAQGYYFDEVLGTASSGTITLRSIADLNTDTKHNINLLTTLAYNRIQSLVGTGMTISDARTQAEAEVLRTFNINSVNFIGNFGSLDIAGHGDGDNVLAAISSLFVNGNTPADLSNWIADFQADLADNGVIDDAPIKTMIANSASTLNPAAVAANLTKKYSGVPTPFAAADISSWLDNDGDGVIGKYEMLMEDAGSNSTYTLPAPVVAYLSGQPLTLSTGQISINGKPASDTFTLASGDTVVVSPAALFTAGKFDLYLKTGTSKLARVRFIIGLASIAVTPASPSVPKGLTTQLTAVGTFSDSSTADLTNSVTWASADTNMATVNAMGSTTGVATGNVQINVASGSVSGSTTLTVAPAVLQSITVTPANAMMGVQQTQQYTATGTYSDSSKSDITSSVTWSSSNAAVAAIDVAGLATAISKGSVTIGAADGMISGSTGLFVASPWAWVSGSNTVNASGVYGTRGAAAAGNVPGARNGSVSWKDAAGNLWLFGGWGKDSGGVDAYLNDLWKWDGAHWTWVSGSSTGNATGVYGTQGSPAANNVPGARNGSVSWFDGANLWLFGGWGRNSAGANTYLNDLWKWDGTQWTWVSGSNMGNDTGVYGMQGIAAAGNAPGARYDSVSWFDGANLWLFVGWGKDAAGAAGYLNDLWKWDGTQWIWVSGSVSVDVAGIYGAQGIAAAGNVPGARYGSIAWKDTAGNFWLFGGMGSDSAGGTGYLNDLWKWDGTQWTWVSGSSTVNAAGVYGIQGAADANNAPGARYVSISWFDGANLWLFGGWGWDSTGKFGNLNDLWKWNGTQWIWISGSNNKGATGAYGTQGVGAASNVPGARGSSVSWIDGTGNLWLFGGDGHDSAGTTGMLNDFWKFSP